MDEMRLAQARQELKQAKTWQEENPYSPWLRDLVVAKARAVRRYEGKVRLMVVEVGP
jgi:hypothetical protein